MTPELSVLLLTRNAGGRFREVLDALFSCRGIERSEVVVVDSGSTDGTAELAAGHGGERPVRVHRIAPEEFGHGRTRNLAASLARAPVLVFLVQDATPADAGFLEELVAPLADPRVAGVYGRQIARPEATPVERELLRRIYPETADERLPAPGPGRPVTLGSIFFSNVCSAIRRDAWERFPFDESLIMSEDQRWARDVLSAGYRVVYRPSAVVLHSHHYGLGRLVRRNFDSGYSLTGITEDSWHGMFGWEYRFLRGASASLWRRGEARWIPWLLVHEAARALGFALGRHARWLPRPVRTRLSLHRGYWA